jgi:hypothetical protein
MDEMAPFTGHRTYTSTASNLRVRCLRARALLSPVACPSDTQADTLYHFCISELKKVKSLCYTNDLLTIT